MIYVMSGGGTKFFAAIGATYPAGSTLTCTSQQTGKVMTAKPKSADNTEWVFAIPEPKTLPETWTVTATLGTNSKSQSVSITKEGQFESVELIYQLFLFDGSDNTSITGGWDADGHGSPTAVVETTVGLDINVETGAARQVRPFIAVTKNPIDLSSYTKLCANITDIDLRGNEDGAWLCVASSVDCDATLEASQSIDGTGKVSANISNVSSGYVGLKLEIVSDSYAQLIGSVYASKIWLE